MMSDKVEKFAEYLKTTLLADKGLGNLVKYTAIISYFNLLFKEKIPEEVQNCIDVLDKYEEDETLSVFHIIHMYPKDIAHPNGFIECRNFDLVVFNINKLKKRTYKCKDGITLNTNVKSIHIHADGSTMIKLNGRHRATEYKMVEISRV